MTDKTMTIGPGVAVYPALQRPDTKFDENGTYKADVSMPKEKAKAAMQELAAIFKAHTGKAPKATNNTMWCYETDEEGEETGNVVFKCRIKNRLNREGKLWDRKPALFDAALKPAGDINPWGGTVMAVSVSVYCWEAGGKKGVSLQPRGVQIIELKTGGGSDASSMGFAAQDGFVAPEDVSNGFRDTKSADDDASDDGGLDGDYIPGDY